MAITVTKNFPYQLLFALCVAVTYLNNYELTFFVWCIAAVLTIKRRYSVRILKMVMCFVGILAIAFIVAFFREFNFYNYVRDITYLLKPILGLLIGYQLCRNYDIKPFHTIIYTGLLIGLIHLGIIFYSAFAYKIYNIHLLRFYGGYFGDFEFFALIFLFFSKDFQIDISPKRRMALLLVIGFSAFFYLSRTNFIQFGILFLAIKGYFKLTPRAITFMGILFLVTAVGYSMIYNMNLSRNGRGAEAFLYKIKNAPIEAFKTKVNTEDYEDFNDNYRSFENIITVRQVSYDGNLSVIFGKGMGATIDVGREMWTNDLELIRYIPTLHNGFMTVFLKSGLVGVFLYIIFLFFLGRPQRAASPIVQKLNLFFIGTAIFLVFASWVLLGLYLKIDNKALLIGFLLCYRELESKNYNAIQATNENP